MLQNCQGYNGRAKYKVLPQGTNEEQQNSLWWKRRCRHLHFAHHGRSLHPFGNQERLVGSTQVPGEKEMKTDGNCLGVGKGSGIETTGRDRKGPGGDWLLSLHVVT